jgi:phosphotriesterase-related protein
LSTIGDQTPSEAGSTAATRARVRTVTGPLDPGELGVTLIHEHLLMDGSCFFEASAETDAEAFAGLSLTSELVDRVRSESCSNRDNLRLDDLDLAAEELNQFLTLGGRTVVDVTSSVGLGRDPRGLRALAERTGANVVMGTGLYCEYSHPADIASATTEEIAELIVSEIVDGVDGVHAGVIGEIGVNGEEKGTLRYVGEMTASEERGLRAACRACLETGAAVIVHQPNRVSAVPEILRVLEEEGAPPGRVVLGHMSSVPDFAMHLEVLERGYWVAYDNFGMALENRRYRPIRDSQRIEWLLEVMSRGFADRVLVSHDVWCKVQLRRHGGGGYGHILRTIVPELRERGLSQDDLDRLLVHNPAEVLAF